MAGEIRDAPAAFKSNVWPHFGFKNKTDSQELDMSNAFCKLCKTRIKYSGNTTNLRAHLTRHHPEVTAQPPAKPVDPTQLRIDTIHSSKLPAGSERAKKITNAVVYFICKDIRPYSIVENEGFRYMLNTLEPRYVIPTRRYITDTAVPKLYEEVKQEVVESLSKAERVALTCDVWTSRATESYVTITSHYISDQWKLVSHVLQTRVMYESHSGSNIADLLGNAVEEWNITEKDPAIVTDNASNMVIAARLAGFVHIKCFAHTLNLASQRALKPPTVSRLLGRVRRITNFFRRSTLGCHACPATKAKTTAAARTQIEDGRSDKVEQCV